MGVDGFHCHSPVAPFCKNLLDKVLALLPPFASIDANTFNRSFSSSVRSVTPLDTPSGVAGKTLSSALLVSEPSNPANLAA